MLWKKESNESKALYIDILKSVNCSDNFGVNIKKNNELSVSARVTGNMKIKSNDYEGAMKSYNKSICFAGDNDHLSLAYANRSYCFLKLNFFDRCLKDIQYAHETHYPEHLAPKLENRKKICLEKLGTQSKLTGNEPKLSCEADPKLPCISKVLKIETSELYGRYVTAKCDISIGDTLLVEKAYVRSSTGIECLNCAEKNMNFIPCPHCAEAMYCSETCSKNNFHPIECNMMIGRADFSYGKTISFVLRSLIIGINNFSSIDKMIAFVDNCLSTDPKEIPQSISSPMSMYRTFFKLSSYVCDEQILNFREQASSIYNAIMSSPLLAAKFTSQASQRFLAHLIIHHGLIVRSNAFGGLCEPADDINGNDSSGKSLVESKINTDYERNIFLVTSYFNHSCLPNVTKLSKDNLAVVKAIQPIKKNQQLFVTYLAGELVKTTGKDRNDDLESGYGFRCSCELCTNGLQKQFLILENDSDFQYVVNNVKKFQHLISNIKDRCITFLLNHPNTIASEPTYYVLSTLVAMLQKELDRVK